MNKEEIYKYFLGLAEEEKALFLDLLNDLESGVIACNNIKFHYGKCNDFEKEIVSGVLEAFKRQNIKDVSGLMYYKKIDYTKSKAVKEFFDTNIPQNLSKLAMLRRIMICELCKFGVLTDLKIDMNTLINEKEMEQEGLIKIQDGKRTYNFDYQHEQVSKIYKKFKKGKELTRAEKMLGTEYIIFQEIKQYYGQEQLDDDLNIDSSYKDIFFFLANEKDLHDLKFKLQNDKEKNYINSYEFKDKNLYINGEIFNIKDSPITSYFIEILSGYLALTDTKIINIGKLVDYYEQNGEKGKGLKLLANNIKTSYISTINKQVGKQYINNEILKIKSGDIVLL